MGVTQELAEWSVGYKYKDIPEKVIYLSKGFILDTIGVAFPGAKDPVGQIVTRLARKLGGEPQAGVIGGGFKTSLTEAAFANGTMIHALDYDDMSFGGHASGCIVPVLMALGELRGSTGKDWLLAYTVGMETFGKAAWTGSPGSLNKKGYHPTAIYGTAAAAIAACKLMGFNVAQTQNTLGIMGSLTCGLLGNFGTMSKPMHMGTTNRAGIQAALMTEEGFTGFPEIIEHQSGFAHTFFTNEGDDASRWTRDLGNPLRITFRGPSIKKYACCGGNHHALDAALKLQKENGFTFNDVDHVTVDVTAGALLVLRYFEAENEYQAKFCIPYNIAAALIDGKHDLSIFDEKRIKSKQMVEAIKKVKLITTGEGGGGGEGQSVRIYLKNGRMLQSNMQALHGSPDDPLSDEEIVAKYRVNAKYVLSDGDAERAKDIILNLENVGNIRELMGIISLQK